MPLLQPLSPGNELSGLEQGMNRYFEARDKADERKLREREFKANLKAKGLIESPSGEYDYDPYTQEKRNIDLEQERSILPRQNMQDEAAYLEKGLIKDPSGKLVYSQDEAMARALKNKLTQSQIDKNYREKISGSGSGSAGGKIIPSATLGTYSGAGSAIKALEDFNTMLQANKDITGSGLGQKFKRGFANAKAMVSGGNDIANRVKEIEAARQKINQTIGVYLEQGKMTDNDRAYYQSILPKAEDSPDVAAVKSAQLQKLIAQRQQAQKDELVNAGYNASALSESNPDLSPLDKLMQGKSGLIKTPAKGLIKRPPPKSEQDLNSMTDEELQEYIGQ